MKIRLEQLNPVVGDLSGNKSKILRALKRAEKDGIELLILPELVTLGYPAQDLLEMNHLKNSCFEVNREIISSTGDTAILFGSITPNENKFGRKIYNSALLAKSGKLIGETEKNLLPTYDVFDDLRYFEPSTTFSCLEFEGLSLGVTICEDIWYNENEIQYHTYDVDPAHELKKLGADVIINISASPYTNLKHENRVSMLRNHVKRLGLPILYSNQVGTQTDIIFDGDTMAINTSAEVIATTTAFEESYTDVVWDKSSRDVIAVKTEKMPEYPKSKSERQFKAILNGLIDYINKTGFSNSVVIGLSGGIDSALVCAIAVEALGAENVTAITMPSEFSSKGSVTDSNELASNLGIELMEIPIKNLFDNYREALSPAFGDRPFDTAEENLQSRIRGSLLMAYSNKMDSFLLTTGNKSEYAVGYATLYGDMNGALAIIGDLYKTEVFELCEWLNREYYQKEVIPSEIINKPPSAELRPDQKDSDSLPDYEVLDNILFQYIEQQKSKEEIIAGGANENVVTKIITLVDTNEFKRYQAAPILKMSSKSFGIGRRWPIVQGWSGEHLKKI